ncbi:MAG: mevalonate kinase [Methanobacteriota archaeon]|jgi:mevalonate kinase|nr:MAG: mevalonate kinase [Euryarchaeota archaeon]HIG19290.1 mevalonate kinase [Candidatus Poseidoniales archaeon]
MVTASAAGKAILFGEHAVVYGEPALAVAIDARVSVSLEPCDGDWKIDGYPLDSGRHPHVVYLRNAILGEDSQPYSIHVNSELFPAAGLGSSAALSSACSAAMLSTIGQPLDQEKIATLSHLAEAAAQSGRASPTDTSTATLGGCVFVSDKKEESSKWRYTRSLDTPEGERNWEVHSVSLPPSVSDLWIVVGYTGIHSPTGDMVAGLAELLAKHPEKMTDISRMGEVARNGVDALSRGDFTLVGELMDEAHQLLAGVGVSCQELDVMVEVARRSSLGAKMTGAGGGGCMLALTTNPDETSAALEMRGGRVLVTPFGAPSVRIENTP